VSARSFGSRVHRLAGPTWSGAAPAIHVFPWLAAQTGWPGQGWTRPAMTARGRADLLIEQRVQCARRLRRSSGPARLPSASPPARFF
jgi:hypothetical protein